MGVRAKALRIAGSSESVFKFLFPTGYVAPKWKFPKDNFDPSKREQQTRLGVVSLSYGEFEVTVSSAQQPAIEAETPVRLSGLTIGGGASGLWFAADAITVAVAA
jgi:hypothetical protein